MNKNKNETKMGRPPLYDEALVQVMIGMPEEMYHWLLEQPKGAHATLRELIENAMSANTEYKK
ncbi:MAG: DUF2239 family protein [Christensenellales bacterium]|jgi:hypothetical protein